MSCVEYKKMEIENSASEKKAQAGRAKPFAVPNGQVLSGDQVASRIAEVLDFQLAQGSMPA